MSYVDVDGLKLLNDRAGHAAGDALLGAIVAAMRSRLRSYEPIVRVGGDEFVCALAGVDLGAARERFAEIRAAIDADTSGGKISVGFAALQQSDSLEQLIARADRALGAARGR